MSNIIIGILLFILAIIAQILGDQITWAVGLICACIFIKK
jgi:hypothetical protein